MQVINTIDEKGRFVKVSFYHGTGQSDSHTYSYLGARNALKGTDKMGFDYEIIRKD